MSQDLKNTVNLPQTDFPMKANLPQREPELLKFWAEQKVYQKLQKKNEANPSFVMPDGPPYANGDLHMGHTLNKCLKDFVIKYKSMSGFAAPFIPGWDCHGLPIEHKVEKDLGKAKLDKTAKEIRELCRLEAKKWVAHQRDQFKRLGIMADWENPYLTLDPSYEAEEVRELARIHRNGVIYKGVKPVYWCWALQTALAEAEIEYQNHKSPSIYVKFPMDDAAVHFAEFNKPVSCVIWTTTPWTLPANFAICLRDEFDYSFYEFENEILFLATGLAEQVAQQITSTDGSPAVLKEIGPRVKGSQLENLKAHHPFYDRTSLFILGDHVTLEAGTGCVHTAPGHGQDDYIVGLKYNLPVFSPVDAYGKYTVDVPEYQGIQVFQANPLIVERLKEGHKLLGMKEITHSYPHCWRSKTPLIFRATAQWFLRMDDHEFNVRAKALTAINKIQFVPEWGTKRLTAMVENRPDWCLTRQRKWGVPLPIFNCKNCEESHFTYETSMKVADLMENEGGMEAFFDKSVEELAGPIQCEKCGSTDFEKNKDILDVWFDSGVCFAAVQRKRKGLAVPADMYLEGSDQHRGWFQTSLLASIASTGEAPFKMLLTHNFVNDAQGRKMSKSMGNGVDPMDLTNKNGAEILRLWVAAEDYGNDINFSQESYNRVTECYRRFRNTMRYLLGNLHGFDPKTQCVPTSKMPALDRWALLKLNALIETCIHHNDRYEFFRAFQALNQYFTVELSANYLDVIKDRLYTQAKDGKERRSAQTVLWYLLNNLTLLIAPFASFLAEETYSHFPVKTEESVFLLNFPKSQPQWKNEELEAEFVSLLEVKSAAAKILEEMRTKKEIGASLEARLEISASAKTLDALKKHLSGLREFFIVSQVDILEQDQKPEAKQSSQNTFTVSAFKARGDKCPRCWNYAEDIGQSAQFPEVCSKCAGALK